MTSVIYIIKLISRDARNLFGRPSYSIHNLHNRNMLLQNCNLNIKRFALTEATAIVNYELQHANKNDIITLINDIEKSGSLKNDSLSLMKCCGRLPDEIPQERMTLVERLVKVFEKHAPLNVDFYNTLLECHIVNKVRVSYKDFLNKMQCKPNEITYRLLLQNCAENGDDMEALEIVQDMKSKGFPMDESVFSYSILAYLKKKDLKSVKSILDTMRIMKIELTLITYTNLLRGYAEIGNIELFKNTLNKATTFEITNNDLIQIIESVSYNEDNLDAFLSLIKESLRTQIETRSFYKRLSDLCIHFIYLKKPKVSYKIFKSLVSSEIDPEGTYGIFLLEKMVDLKIPSNTIIEIANDLVETGYNPYALLKVTECCLKVSEVDLTLELFDVLHKKGYSLRTHYFWPLLIQKSKSEGEKGIFEIFNIMKNYKVPINSETLETYSLNCIQDFDSEIIINHLKELDLSIREIIPSIQTVLLNANKTSDVIHIFNKYNVKIEGTKLMKPLAKTFSKTNDVGNCLKIVKICEKSSKIPGILTGQFLLNIFRNNFDDKKILNLLQKCQKDNLEISNSHYEKITFLISKNFPENINRKNIESILDKLVNNIVSEPDPVIPHPRNMNLEQLECHLVELKNKNMETRGVLRKLIQMHCRLGNSDRVMELMTEFEAAGYKLSPGMMASVLDLHIKNNNCEAAKEIYNKIKLRDQSFIVDEFKVVDLARLLVEADKFDEGMSALKTEHLGRSIRGGPEIEGNCWRCLNSVALTGNVARTKQMMDILVKCNYASVTNVILGPLVRVYLINGNLTGAVEEFVNCSERFGKTPLQRELLHHVIKDPLLNIVLRSIEKVHGKAVTKTSLAAALADLKETGLLRKLLFEEAVPVPLLEKVCTRWVEERNMDALECFATAAEGISIDISPVYVHLMRLYQLNNDETKLLAFWNDIQEKKRVPLEKMKIMYELLNKNKLSL